MTRAAHPQAAQTDLVLAAAKAKAEADPDAPVLQMQASSSLTFSRLSCGYNEFEIFG